VTPGRDAYATRYEPEFDEVLDIPLAGQGDYQANEAAPLLEDVFAAPAYDPPPVAPAPPPLEVRTTAPLLDRTSENIFNAPFETPFAPPPEAQPEAQPEAEEESKELFALPEQNGHAPQPSLTNWPVLSGDRTDFGTARKTPSPSRSSSIFMRVALMAVVFIALFVIAWRFLGLQERLMPNSEQTGDVATTRPPAGNQAASGSGASSAGAANDTKSATAPNAAPTAEPKASGASEARPADKPASEASAAGAAAQKNQPAAETAQPAAENKNQKVAPLDVPFGHSVRPSEGSMTLQVASFTSATQANDRVARLKSDGIDARVVRAEIPNRGTWYRVQIGRFTSREEAERYGRQLKARGLVQDVWPTGYQAPQ
jgi:cell division protein FtsN